MVIDKRKYSNGWREIKDMALSAKRHKSEWAMHLRKLETDIGQPTAEIIRLLKLYPQRFNLCCTEEAGAPHFSREWLSFLDKTTKMVFSIKRVELYTTDTYCRRLGWERNIHHCEDHPWFTETELDALCTTVKGIIKDREDEACRKEQERQQELLDSGRHKMMVVYGLTGENHNG